MVAKRPPMGWNSWDCYGAAVDEVTVKKNADYMAENLKDAGWEYIVVDIQWYQPTADSHEYVPFADLTMDDYSRLIPAVNRFPSAKDGQGFGPLAEYVHAKGLKFGIHIMRGIPRQAVHQNCSIKGTDMTARQVARFNSICYWNPDMYGLDTASEGAQIYYNSLFELYASWGVDFVKVDDIARNEAMRECNEAEITLIRKAIDQCGRDIVLSLSPGPADLNQAEYLKMNANMWRITDDFWDKWELLYAMFERAEKWCIHAGAGHWPDADMLPVGPIRQDYNRENWTNFTKDEQRTMLTLWNMMRSPLIIGGEMNGFDDFTLCMLTNTELLEIGKDSQGAHPVYRRKNVDGEQIVWMTNGTKEGLYYVALFNAGENDIEVRTTLDECGLNGQYKCYDIWEKRAEEDTYDEIKAIVKSHGVKLYKLNRI